MVSVSREEQAWSTAAGACAERWPREPAWSAVMHRRPYVAIAAALALALLGPMLMPAGLPLAAAPVRAATPPKVVVVVGPTHSLTASNLQWGEAIAEDAVAHGAQVVRVFHPHATWAEVSAAAAGANVLIYLGHGNGYPSPYTSTLMRDRQDGMGLDPVDGAADDQVQYYGEQYMATLHLAPDSLVLLNHLCYASGNSEPGLPQPTQAVAVERVDNFAAGFIAGGASAVLALGTEDAGGIVDALFGPTQTLDQLFMSTGGVGVAPIVAASVRTPGASLHLDPDSATSGFYRSLAGNLDLLSSAVIGGTGSAGALQGAAPAPSPSPVPPSPDPIPAVPSAPVPVLTSLVAPAAFTPNGDGISDTLTLSYSMSAPGTLDVAVASASGAVVRHMVLPAMTATGRFSWDGLGDGGATVPDGSYSLVVAPLGETGIPGAALTVRTRVLTAIRSPRVAPAVFYPLGGDPAAATTALSMTLTQPATVTWTVTDRSGRVVRTLWEARPTPAGSWTLPWDGTGQAPGSGVLSPMPVGQYFSAIAATTAAGTVLMRSAIWLTPFRLVPSAGIVTAGQTLGLSITAAEPLSAAPRLLVLQPGVAPYVVTARATAALGYRVVFRLHAGPAGDVRLVVLGTDRAGHSLSATTSVPLR
jgi:flagellar hook assembly protein FlgD